MAQPETNWLTAEGAGAPKKQDPVPSPKKLGLGAPHVERGQAARSALDDASPDAGPGETITMDYAVTVPAWAQPGSHWWALAKVMYFGRVRYTECARIQVTGGQ